MAKSKSKPDTNSTKSFIINHMNKDHQDSLSLYLQVYNAVPTSDAKSAHLEDISLNDLLIAAAGTRYTVPVNPPMKSYSDARSRVVAMHKECLEKQGLSDIAITEYRFPRGAHAVAFTLCASAFVLFARRTNFLPGSLVHDSLLHRAPSLAGHCYDIQPLLFPGLLGIHLLEAGLLAVKRLRRHRVPFLSGVWFAWVISTVVEGMTAWQRIDWMVKEKRGAEEKKE